MGEGDALFFDLEFQTVHGSVVNKKIFMHDDVLQVLLQNLHLKVRGCIIYLLVGY